MYNQAAATTCGFVDALDRSYRRDAPFRHWLVEDVLPRDLYEAMAALPFEAPAGGACDGTREANNATRVFLTPAVQRSHPACAALAEGLGAPEAAAAIEELCGCDLAGSDLRIEYAMDTSGFWLEPHTDIRVKLFTMLVYLSPEQGAAHLGTDLYDQDKVWAGIAPFHGNTGLVFIPGDDTWHGFEPKLIDGVRRSLIVNFVSGEWRARDELSGYGVPA